MSIYVTDEEKNKKGYKATKEFTDRVEPRRLFWTKYNMLKDAISVNNDIPIQIITYYGIGGVGKSRLLKQIREELIEREADSKYCYIDFEKVKNLTTAGEEMLNVIKNDLTRRYEFEFPLYDLAYYEYNIRLGFPASKPELESILSKHSQLNFLISVAGEIPLVGTFAKIVQYADEGSTILKNRFNNSKLKEKVLELDNMSLDEIKEMLPYYFAMDMKYNLSNEKYPFVFEIDTYEKLVNELTQLGSIRDIDDWLKGDNGLIQNIPNVLWVIAGREKLKWGNYDKDYEILLDQHLLGDLSFADCKFFLNSAGINDEDIVSQIYKLTGGVPIFLDMCVDTYFKLLEDNKKISIKDFEGDQIKLIERFFKYMNHQERDFITVLSFIGNWTDDEIEEKIKNVLGSFSYNLYDRIKDFSFVLYENDKYKIHDTIRKVIVENAPSIIKHKFDESIINIQEKKIEEIKEQIKEETNHNIKSEDNVDKTKKIDGVKEYENIINELVANINNFLYDNPADNKENRLEYCNKINNLINKIMEYLYLFEKVYPYDNLDYLVNHKRFKNTHEFLIINGLYRSLKRYYCWKNAKRYVEGGRTYYYKLSEDRYAAYRENIDYYNKTRGFYKNDSDKTKQIDYTIMIMAQTSFYKEKKYLIFDSYELERLYLIKNKHLKGCTPDDFSYLYLYYVTGKYEKIRKYLKSFRDYCKKEGYIFFKKWDIRFTISLLCSDIKEFNEKEDIIVGRKISKSDYIDDEIYLKDRNKIISKLKDELLAKDIDYIIDSINNDFSLLDEFAMKLLMNLSKLLKYDSMADSNVRKIIQFLFDKSSFILKSNDIKLIESYTLFMYRLSYFKCNDEDATVKYISVLEKAREKLVEIYGEGSNAVEKVTCEYLARLGIKCYGYSYPQKYFTERTLFSDYGSTGKLKDFYLRELRKINKNQNKNYCLDCENILSILKHDFEISTDVFFESEDKKLYANRIQYIIDYYMSACILARKYNRFEYLDYCISLFKKLIDEQDGIIKTFDEYDIFSCPLLSTITCYNISSYKNINEYINFYDYLFNERILSFKKENGIYFLELAITMIVLAKLTYDMFLTDKDKNYLENHIADNNNFIYKVFLHITLNADDLASDKPTSLSLENYKLSCKKRIFGVEKEYSKLTIPFYTIITNNKMNNSFYEDIIKLKNKENNEKIKEMLDIYIRSLKNLEKIKTLN